VIQLRVFGHSRVLDDIAKQLATIHGARHVILSGNGAARVALLTADLVEDAVDQAVALVKRAGLPSENVVLRGRRVESPRALAVLGVNVVMLLVGGSLTLISQRALARRESQTHSASA
jgi:hypothetical protein